MGHNQACASCEAADLGNTLSVFVLGNTSGDAERFHFKLHFPGGATDLATHVLRTSPIPCEKTRQGLTDASALHRVIVGFQPIRALFKALSAV